MRFKDLDLFRLEDRVLFDAAAAAEVVEAAEAAHDDPNANVNRTEQQARDEKSADVKNAPPENPSERTASDAEPDPAENADVNLPLDAILKGGLPDTGADVSPDIPAVSDRSDESEGNTVDVLVNDSPETVSTDRELVVLNGTLPDKETILAERKPNQDVLILEDGNGLDELNNYLDEHADVKYDAIHFVTHGADGKLSINGEKITTENFDASEWAQVGAHLTDGGDILLYGCDTAKSPDGQALVDKIADASGADVAASIDTTGVHGDWDLEYVSGQVDTAAIAVDDYAHELATEQYIVVNTADDLAVDHTDDTTTISIRDALDTANSESSADVTYHITFAVASDDLQIDLGSTLTISHNLTIDGANTAAGSAGDIVLDGGHSSGGTDGVRIMLVNSGNTVELSNLTFQNGYTGDPGGAIENNGTLTVIDSTFSGNSVSNDRIIYNAKGGAIDNSGTLTVIDSTFSGNSARWSGGAIENSGTLTVIDSTFSGNSASNNSGGAIYNDKGGTLTISDSMVSGNSASNGGGAIYNDKDGALTISDSMVSGNSASNGGAIYAMSGTLTVIDSTFSGNSASNRGGAIYDMGTLTILNSTFSGNSASNSDGGAIANYGTLTVIDSTFSGNSASNSGGAIYSTNYGVLKVSNSLLVGNTVKTSAEDIFTSDSFMTNTYAYYCLIGKIEGKALSASIGLTSGVGVTDVFADVTDGKAVLNADGTFHIKADGIAATAGTKLQVDANGNLQFWNKTLTTPAWTDTGAATTLTTAQLQLDPFGHSRLTNDAAGKYCVGAYTLPEQKSLTVTTTNDVLDAYDGVISLREAISCAVSGTTDADGKYTITFDSSVFAETQTITLNSTLNITSSITIDGAGKVILDGTHTYDSSGLPAFTGVQIMAIKADTVTLNHLTFLNGYADNGGAITNSGTLIVNNSTFIGNFATINGGAIFNDGTLTVTNSTFTGNTSWSSKGNAIYNNVTRTAYVINSILAGGTSQSPDIMVLDSAATKTYVYFSLIGNVSGTLTVQPGSTLNVAAEQIFADVTEDGKAVLSSDGTFHIKTDGPAAKDGTQLKRDESGNLQFLDTTQTTPTWTTVAATTLTTTQLQVDQLGVSRTGTAAQYGAYAVGAYFVEALKETASLTVTTTSDTVNPYDNLISLREAVAYAASGTKADDNTFTITFDGSVFTANNSTITLNPASGRISIADGTFSEETPLLIDGKVSDTVTVMIDGGYRGDDDTYTAIFHIGKQNTATLKNLTLQNAHGKDNYAMLLNDGVLTISNVWFTGNDGYQGGAIFNSDNGSLYIANSFFEGNSASDPGGAIYNNGFLQVSDSFFRQNQSNSPGGAIFNTATALIENSTFSGNTIVLNRNSGGAIYNSGNLTVVNSTFSGNQADWGGAIYNNGTLTVLNATFSGNSVRSYGGAIYADSGTLILVNSILVGNGTYDVARKGGAAYAYYSLIGSATRKGESDENAFTKTIGYVNSGSGATTAIFSETGLNAADGTFHLKSDSVGASNGTLVAVKDGEYYFKDGASWRKASDGSTASDMSEYAITIDQLGNSRMTGSGQYGIYAAGAYFISAGKETASITVDMTTDTINPYDGKISLREAIAYAGTDALGSNILFDSSVFATTQTITLDSTLNIASSITIDGAGKVILDGGRTESATGNQIMKIASGAVVTLSNLTFQNGYEINGGAIYNAGTLAVVNSTFSGNSSTKDGGAIYNYGVLNLIDSTLSGNSASNGGAIYNASEQYLVNSILVGNDAKLGKDVFNAMLSFGVSNTSYSLIGDAVSGWFGSDGMFTEKATGKGVFSNFIGSQVDVKAADIFTSTTPINGMFQIKSDGIAATAGTLAAVKDTAYSFKDGDSWKLVTDPTQTAEESALTVIDKGQNGVSRTAATIYNIGSYALELESKSLSVDTTEDILNPFDGKNSLREAIAYAGTDALGSNITFDSSVFATTQTIPLDSTLKIASSITIDGAGKVILDGGHTESAAGNQIMKIESGAVVTLSNLTFQNGYGVYGGAIGNNGTLTVDNSSFSGNSAGDSGGAIYNANSCSLTVLNSTFSGNSAQNDGGAIYNYGTLNLIDSTLAGNSAGNGGAIYTIFKQSFTNSILVGNTANHGKDIFTAAFYIEASNAYDSLIGDAVSGSFNVEGSFTEKATGKDVFRNFIGSQVDVKAADIFTSTTSINGMFQIKSDGIAATAGTLAAVKDTAYYFKDGDSWKLVTDPTQTAEESALTVIDKGQNGVSRTAATIYNIGSYALELESKSLSVNTTEDILNPFDGKISLREAIVYAADAVFTDKTITFDDTVFTAGNSTISLQSTLILATNTFTGATLTIQGLTNGVNVTLDGGHVDESSGREIFACETGNTVLISHLSFQNGYGYAGGAIVNAGSLTVEKSSFSGNQASYGGGAIANTGTLIVTDASFSDNKSAKYGGAIFLLQDGYALISGSVFRENTSVSGGAIAASNTAMSIINSTFSGNSATEYGGAIYAELYLAVINSTFSENTAASGGAIYIKTGDAYLVNSILVGNTQSDGTTADDLYNKSNNCYAYYSLIGKMADSDGTAGLNSNSIGTQLNISADDIFDGGYSDGVYKIKANGLAAISGTRSGTDSADIFVFKDKVSDSWRRIDLNPALGSISEFTTDQLGVSRIGTASGLGYDAVGAYFVEAQTETKSLTVTMTADTVNPYDGLISLREAIAYAGTDGLGNTILFDSTVFASTQTITLDSTLKITQTISMDGGAKVILSGSGKQGVLGVTEGGRLSLYNFTFNNCSAGNGSGAAIFCEKGTVLAVNSTFYQNHAAGVGGAIFNLNGSLTVINSTFSGNTAAVYGGAIYSTGNTAETILINNIMTGNSAESKANDLQVDEGSLSAFYNVFNVVNGVGITLDSTNRTGVAATDAFSGTELNSDGTFRIKADGVGARSGTLAAVKDGAYYFKAGSSWKKASDGSVLADEFGLTILTQDQIGQDRTQGEAVNYGIYAAGAYFAAAVKETESTVVTMTSDTVNPYDGWISFREAVSCASSSNGNTITFTSGNGTLTLNSAVTVDKDIVIGNGFNISTSAADGKLFSLSTETAELNFNSVTLGNGTIEGPGVLKIISGTTLTVENLTVNCASFGNSGTLLSTGSLTFNAAITHYGSVNYAGASQTVAAGTYNDLILSGSGTKTANGDVAVGRNLQTTDNVMFDMNAALSLSSGIDNLGSITLSGAFTPGTGNSFGNFSYDGASQTVAAGNYDALTLAGSGTKTLAGAVTADSVAINGSANSIITLEGGNNALTVSQSFSAAYATINHTFFSSATTVDSWNQAENTNTVDGSGNQNLTIFLSCSTFSGSAIVYGETLKNNSTVTATYSLRGINADMRVFTSDSSIYDVKYDENGRIIARTEQVLLTTDGGYQFNGGTTLNPVTFTVNPKTVDVTWTANNDYIYNGTDQGSSVSAEVTDGRVGSDTIIISVFFSGRDAEFQNAGNYTATATSGNGNYTIHGTTRTLALVMNKAGLSIAGTDKYVKVGGNAPTDFGSTITSGKLFGSDVFKVTGTSDTVDMSKEGDYTLNEYSFEGADNYDLTFESGTLHVMNTITVNVGTSDETTKIYDGTALALSSGNLTYDELEGYTFDKTDAVLVYSGDRVNAGEYSYTVTGIVVTRNGLDVSFLFEFIGSETLTVNQREITISGISADNKVYDGTTDAVLNYGNVQFNGLVSGDSLSVSTVGTFADKNAGVGKTVAFGALTLGGESVGNYKLASTGHQTSATADITQREITVSGIAADNKIYDGTTDAALNYEKVQFGGLVSGDSLTVSTIGTFADKNAEVGKAVTFGALTLGGESAGNYKLATDGQQTSATADITQRKITVSGISADNKIYDGTTDAALNYENVQFGGLVSGDELMVSTVGTFADKNVEFGKDVTFGVLTLGGESAGNYKLATDGQQTSTTADITQKAVTVSGIIAENKVYDGTTDAALNYENIQFGGLVSGDELMVSTVGTFADKNVEFGKAVTFGVLTLGGESAGNYKLATDGQQTSTTADITQREITVSGISADNKIYDGTTDAALNYENVQFGGLVSGDSLTVSTIGTFADKNAATGKAVTFGTLTLGGESAGNYKLASTGHQTSVTADITQREITVSGISADNKIYDGTTDATLNYDNVQFGGLVSGDTLTVSTVGTFGDRNAAESKTVLLGTLTLGGESSGNYRLADSGRQTSAVAAILLRPLNLSADDVGSVDKVYDGGADAYKSFTYVTDIGETLSFQVRGTYNGSDVSGSAISGEMILSTAVNYATNATVSGVNGMITSRIVDALWSDHTPYFWNGQDQGSTVSASYTDVNGKTVALTVEFSGPEPGFCQAGEYRATAASADPNYAVSGATSGKTYTMTAVGESNTDTFTQGLNWNFNSLESSILGSSLAMGSASGPAGGNLYTAPYSTLLSVAEINVRSSGYSMSRPGCATEMISLNPVGPAEPPLRPGTFNERLMTMENPSPDLSFSVSGGSNLIQVEAFASGRELFPGGEMVSSPVPGTVDFSADGFDGADRTGGGFEYLRQPVRMLRSFFSGDGSGAQRDPGIPDFDLTGVPPVDPLPKNDGFKSDLERLLEEMLVPA